MEVTQLDAFALGTQSIPQRIRALEHRQRRTGIRSRYAAGGPNSNAGMSRINFPSVTGDPSGETSTTIHPLPDTMDFSNTYGAPNALPPISLVRKNRITNGSFEYFQNGDPLPFGWTGSVVTVVKPPSIFPMDGQYVARMTQGGTLQQIMVGTEQVPAGSWVLSVWVYSSIASTLTLSLGVSVDPNVYFGTVQRIDAAGTSATNVIPAGEWCRFYRSIVTSIPTQIQLYFENETLGNIMYLDAVKLEMEAGVQSLLEPTAYVDDERAATTIIRSLRADSITAGTLAVGGSNAGNPVIYVYDNTDQLIASLGAPVGGYRGLNIMGQAGIKVQAGGTIEAGNTRIDQYGVAIALDSTVSGNLLRSVRFTNPDGTLAGALCGSAGTLGTGTLVMRAGATYSAASPSVTLIEVGSGLGGEALLRAGDNFVRCSTGGGVTVDAGLFAFDVNAKNINMVGGVSGVVINSDAGITLNPTGNLTVKGFVRSWPTVAGTVAQGAGELSAITLADVSGAAHTHAILAYTAPGTTANRLIKTGVAGAVTLADLTASVFRIGASTLTVSTSGNLALGAATLTGSTTNDATVAGHTHAVDAYSVPGATVDRLIKTGAAGAVTLADLTASVFRIGASALTVSTSGNLALGAATLTGSTTNNAAVAGHTHAVDAYSVPGATVDRLIKTGVAGAVTLADLTASVFRIGASTLTVSAAGNIALGAASLSGTTNNDATLTGHTHFVDAFSAPGTTASRLLKTGVAGNVTLADLTASVFRIGASTLTVSTSGNLALGAGTLSAATANADATATHTHAITTSAAAVASTIVATDGFGEVVAKLKATSTIAHPGWTSASTIMANSWVDFGAGSFAGAGYYKDATGRVWLRGVIKNGTINTTMLTLPVGFRPVFQHVSLVMSQVAQIRVDVLTTGAVAAQSAPAGSYTYLSLDGINFMTV